MRTYYFVILAVLAVTLSSCGEPKKEPELTDQKINLNTNVEQLARFAPLTPIGVHGFGMVGGLWGTGSSECPATLRPVLEKYIRQQIPNSTPKSIREFIESPDTAVVEIVGQIPPMAMIGERFDIKVLPLAKTQTMSLESGQLFTADLVEYSRLISFDQYAKNIGSVWGPIFTEIDPNSGKQVYYVLGGGISGINSPINLILNQPNYYAAAAIRNQINERFGPNTANAVSRSEIRLTIPERFRNEKARFLSMIRTLYLAEEDADRTNRIKELCLQLSDPQKADDAEFALEAIGKPSAPALFELIDSNAPEAVRFSAARCMLNIGDNRSVLTLGEIAKNTQSQFRVAAIKALSAAKLKDIEPILSRLVEDSQLDVRIAAYEQLVGFNSVLVTRIPIGSDFFVDLVHSRDDKIIYAYRKDNARIVLFGSPITCKKDIFIDMKQVMINAKPNEDHVSLVRRHPSRPKLVGPIQCSFKVEDLIRTLGQPPEVDTRKMTWPGLGISYSEILTLLDQMCQREIIPAKFILGPVTDAGAFLEKSAEKTDNISAKETKP
jgi:hypothetical protein